MQLLAKPQIRWLEAGRFEIRMARNWQRAPGPPAKRVKFGTEPGRPALLPARFTTVPGEPKWNFPRLRTCPIYSKRPSSKPQAVAGGWATMPGPGPSAPTPRNRSLLDWSRIDNISEQ